MIAQWLELARLGLLGTDRAVPDGALAQELAGLGLDLDTDLNEFLLNGAALLRLPTRIQAGFQAYSGTLPEPMTLNHQERNCSPRTAMHLAEILSGKYDLALEEFVLNLVEQKKILPAEQLPSVFNRSLSQSEIWPLIRQAMGARGGALLAQNPDWAPLIRQQDPARWPVAELPERRAILKFLNVENPDKALGLVRSVWKQATPAERVVYLSGFAENPSALHETFWMECLDDSRKEVRQAAADLLAALPGSALSNQLFQWASGCLSVEKERINLNFPAHIPQDSVKYGIRPATGQKGEGEKSAWFRQLLARIPPGKWEIYFQKDAPQIVAALKNTRNNGPLIESWSEAVIRFGAATWAEAFTGLNHEGLWSGTSGKKLARLIPSTAFNRLTLQALSRNAILEEKSPLTQILCMGQHPWEKNLSKGLIRQFQGFIGSSRTYNWDSGHYKKLLEVAGYKTDTALTEEFRTGWPFNSPVWARWEPEVEKMLQILNFRDRMLQELKG